MIVVYSSIIVCVVFLFTCLTMSYAETVARRSIRKRRSPDIEDNVDFSNIFYSPTEMQERLRITQSRVTNLDDYFAKEDDGQFQFYPLKAISDYFESNPVMKTYFKKTTTKISQRGNWGSDNSQEDEGSIDIQDDELVDDDDGEYGRLCNLKSYYYSPQILPNTRGQNRIIINHSKYEQLVKTERCIERESSNNRCRQITFKDPKYKNITSSCQHAYRTWKLAVFNSDTKKMEYDFFKIPSCCTCRVMN